MDSRPRVQPLDLISHWLVEFQYSKFDEVEVPGQYLEVSLDLTLRLTSSDGRVVSIWIATFNSAASGSSARNSNSAEDRDIATSDSSSMDMIAPSTLLRFNSLLRVGVDARSVSFNCSGLSTSKLTLAINRSLLKPSQCPYTAKGESQTQPSFPSPRCGFA